MKSSIFSLISYQPKKYLVWHILALLLIIGGLILSFCLQPSKENIFIAGGISGIGLIMFAATGFCQALDRANYPG